MLRCFDWFSTGPFLHFNAIIFISKMTRVHWAWLIAFALSASLHPFSFLNLSYRGTVLFSQSLTVTLECLNFVKLISFFDRDFIWLR